MSRNIKKVLVTFELNKTLLFAHKPTRVKTFGELSQLEQIPRHDHAGGYDLYFRGGRPELLEFLFMENHELFEVGVWSSLDADNTSLMAKSFFGRYYRNLAFAVATRREEYEGVLRQVSVEPLQVKRNFAQLSEKCPGFEHNNIIMASNHRNLVDEYSANDILLSSYDPMTLGNTFATDFALHAFVKYLRGIKIFITGKKNIQDIRPMLQAKHFSNMLDRMTNTAASYNEYT